MNSWCLASVRLPISEDAESALCPHPCRHENPLVADLSSDRPCERVRCFLLTKVPDFINTANTWQLRPRIRCVHQLCAALPGNDEQPHDRVPVQAGEAFGAADRAALKQDTGSHAMSASGLRNHRVAGQFSVGFREIGSCRKCISSAARGVYRRSHKAFTQVVCWHRMQVM